MAGEKGAEAQTVTLPPAPAATAKPTEQELKDGGFSEMEMQAAKKHGLTGEEKFDTDADDAAKKGGAVKASAGPAGAGKAAVDKGAAEKAEADKAEAARVELARKNGMDTLPDGFESWPKEAQDNARGLYIAQKKERARAQKANADLAKATTDLQDAMRRVEALEKAKPAPRAEERDPLDDLLDPDGKENAGKTKFLTEEDLARIDKEKADKAAKVEAERRAKLEVMAAALEAHEAEARAKYPDFDETLNLAGEILEQGRKVEGLDADRFELAVLRGRRAQWAMANAGEWDQIVEQHPEMKGKTPADLMYELGKLHPKYKPASAGKPEKPAGAEDPDAAKKALENSQLKSSAALDGGGGGRTVTEDEITVAMAGGFTQDQWSDLSPKTRARLRREAS